MTIVYVSAVLVVLVVATAALLRRRSPRSRGAGISGGELGRARLHHHRDMDTRKWSDGHGI